MIGQSQSFRVLFVSTLLSATLATIAMSGFLLWPVWQKHRAVSALIDAIKQKSNDADGRDQISGCAKAVDAVEAWDLAVSSLTELLHDEDVEVRKNALGYIDWWSSQVPQAFSIVVSALKGEDEEVAQTTVVSLDSSSSLDIAG